MSLKVSSNYKIFQFDLLMENLSYIIISDIYARSLYNHVFEICIHKFGMYEGWFSRLFFLTVCGYEWGRVLALKNVCSMKQKKLIKRKWVAWTFFVVLLYMFSVCLSVSVHCIWSYQHLIQNHQQLWFTKNVCLID